MPCPLRSATSTKSSLNVERLFISRTDPRTVRRDISNQSSASFAWVVLGPAGVAVAAARCCRRSDTFFNEFKDRLWSSIATRSTAGSQSCGTLNWEMLQTYKHFLQRHAPQPDLVFLHISMATCTCTCKKKQTSKELVVNVAPTPIWSDRYV